MFGGSIDAEFSMSMQKPDNCHLIGHKALKDGEIYLAI